MENYIGKYCVVRGDRSGVLAGVLSKHEGHEVTLTDVRRIWYWDGATEVLGLASVGTTKPGKCKFTQTVSEMTVLDAIEIVPCTVEAEKILKAVPEWKA